MSNNASFTPPSLLLSTIGLSLATFMQVLDTTIANVALPTISGNLGVSSEQGTCCLLYTSPSPRDATLSRMPSSA